MAFGRACVTIERMLRLLAIAIVLTLTACKDPVERMRADAVALAARPEHPAEKVKVTHILISYKGAPRMEQKKLTRSLSEAEKRAAEVYGRARAGEDFPALVKEFSDDSPEGTYDMTQQSRSGMVPAFGNVAWRLQVGEIGVAPNHSKDSPFGWHIIKRTE